LWSSYWRPIHAPDWWIDQLPAHTALDGELWIDRGLFQETMSICRSYDAGDRWKRVQYRVFDSPPPFERGIIEIKRDDFVVVPDGTPEWSQARGWNYIPGEYRVVYDRLRDLVPSMVVDQTLIANTGMYDSLLSGVYTHGGEGLMLRAPGSYYVYERTRRILKVKDKHDADGTVLGYVDGNGKYEGLVGSLIVQMDNGIRVDVSGMRDNLRVPGAIPIGSRISFWYRELSTNGVPKEARYWRTI
jgi:DNA ligase-1